MSAQGNALPGINSSTQVVAGSGLSGGGALTGNVTLNVGANVDGSIIINSDDIQVGVLATDVQHGNRGGGSLHNAATIGTAGFMAAADKLFLSKQQNAQILVTSNAYSNLAVDGATDDLAALNLLYTNAPDHSVLIFPPGVMLLSNTATIPTGKHFAHKGAGEEKTYFQSTHQTADIISVGDWQNTFEDITFKSTNTTTTSIQTLPVGTINVISTANFANSGSCTIATTTGWQTVAYTGKTSNTLTGCTGGTGNTSNGGAVIFKTAGYAINSGTNSYIFIKDCGFSFLFNGWLNNATLCGIYNCDFTSTINFDIQFNGPNVNAIVHNCTFDGLPQAVSHIEVNQCGSLLISDCDIIRGINNLRINPTSPNGCFGIYTVNTYFDTASGSSVKFMGSGNIQRVKIANCWLSGSVNGLEFTSTAATLPTAIDITNCDFYSNSANGILAIGGTVQDWSITQCRIAGNITAGINTSASTVHVPRIVNNRIGPTGGIGANGTGIILGAGTYSSINIVDNDITGNTTAAITDSGATSTISKTIIGNTPSYVWPGGRTSISAATATSGTGETIIYQLVIPTNTVIVGTTFRIRAFGVTAASGNPTFRVRLGTAGTVADTAVCATAIITSAAAAFAEVEFLITVRAVGAGGTAIGTGITTVGTIITATGTAPATIAMNTTVANTLTFTTTMSTSTLTYHNAIIEIVKQ